jgi:hypothetical protein
MPKRDPVKVDLYKEHKAQYVQAKKPVLLTIPPVWYLAIDGQGEPSGEAFTTNVGAMYNVAFTLKMTRKFAGKGDYKVCGLEALWWAQDKNVCFMDTPREKWCWKLLIRTPEFVTQEDLSSAHKVLSAKGKGPEVARVLLETIEEGLCVQMLHVGPYADEPATLAEMERFAGENGLAFAGRHHELYLSDPRRVPPERLRTILRMPLKNR